MSYRLQKFLILMGVYASSVLITTAAVGDLSRGFGYATASWMLLYAAAVEINRG